MPSSGDSTWARQRLLFLLLVLSFSLPETVAFSHRITSTAGSKILAATASSSLLCKRNRAAGLLHLDGNRKRRDPNVAAGGVCSVAMSSSASSPGGGTGGASAAASPAAAEGGEFAKPALPIPPPILSLTPGTWAHDTMSRRVEADILQRTWEENAETLEGDPDFAEAAENFRALREELRSASTTRLRHLTETAAAGDDVRARELDEWRTILEPYVSNGDTWLSAPWMVTEFYVYRRLMEAIGHFDGSNAATLGYDPFLKQKRAGLVSSVPSAEPVMARVEALPKRGPEWRTGASVAAELALWGNKMDLSIWPADVVAEDGDGGGGGGSKKEDAFARVLQSATENLLHDDTDLLLAHMETLRGRGGGNVDIIVDNAGFELVTDLALADHLVADGVARRVTFQLKSHPTFVSDAMEFDLRETVEHYAGLDGDEFPNCKRAGERWKSYLGDGRWACHEDSFWVQPLAMWDMPEPLRSDMKERCDLAFVKGDANYRRLLGDRFWDYTAPFQDVVGCYFPCPVCALRTLKAEVGCGMEAEQVERAKSLDDEWLVNGRFGVIHFGTGEKGAAT